jgi:histidyl-tRNA synthetase
MKKLTGMKDLLDIDYEKYNYFLEVATSVLKSNNFNFIKTPLLEDVSLFKRTAGESTDIVSKEMYEFKDQSDNIIALRPEGTAGIMRYYIENGLDKMKAKKKFFYYGSMFRYERPQKGRFREFTQFGVESIGESSIYEELNIINQAYTILTELNVKFTLKINSIGCSCRNIYKKELKKYINRRNNICDNCKIRKEKNILRVLDCKEDNYSDAPNINEYICTNCTNDFNLLKDALNKLNIKFEVDPTLVRGLDYYNGTVFEFVSEELGSQGTICAGGRYDKLSEQLGGKPVPAVGLAFGIERLMELIDLPYSEEKKLYICTMRKELIPDAMMISNELSMDYRIVLDYSNKSVGTQIRRAEKNNCKYFLVIGDQEIGEGKYKIKNLDNREEKYVFI